MSRQVTVSAWRMERANPCGQGALAVLPNYTVVEQAT
jgi:hypothetical protein